MYLDISHPVHIFVKGNKLSPSAFIPFCEFGGNMSAMGAKIPQFEVPVCNSFEPKILNDQLCYEVDLKKFSDRNNKIRYLESGFAFIMDFNEDRQSRFVNEFKRKTEIGLVNWISESNHEQSAFIYMNTVGMNIKYDKTFIV